MVRSRGMHSCALELFHSQWLCTHSCCHAARWQSAGSETSSPSRSWEGGGCKGGCLLPVCACATRAALLFAIVCVRLASRPRVCLCCCACRLLLACRAVRSRRAACCQAWPAMTWWAAGHSRSQATAATPAHSLAGVRNAFTGHCSCSSSSSTVQAGRAPRARLQWGSAWTAVASV
jgi:hypothetical protein